MQKFATVWLLLFIQWTVICVTSAVNKPFFNSKTLSVLCYKTNATENPILQPIVGNVGPCPLPVSKLRAARHEVAVVGDYYTEPPEWLNVTLATIGQNFLRKNTVGYLYSAAMGAILLGTSVDVRRILFSSGSIRTPESASRRYLGALLHSLYWANADIVPSKCNPTKNMCRTSQADMFETLNLIRSIHGEVVYQADATPDKYRNPGLSRTITEIQTNEPLWKAFADDLATSTFVALKHQPIFPPRDGGTHHYFNQFGILLQYWANTFLIIMKPEVSMFMSEPTEEELQGYLHFWGFLAHVMGLRPEYNICLQPDIPTAKKYFKDILEEYFVPGLFHMDYETKVMTEVSIKAFTKTFPFLDEGLVLKQLLEDVLDVEAKHVGKAMSRQAKIYASIMKRFRFMTRFPSVNSAISFVIKGMIQVSTMEYFGFNILKPDNFTNGIIAMDENVLEHVNLWKKFRKNKIGKNGLF